MTLFDEHRIARFVALHHGVDPAAVRLRLTPLLGGLQARGIARVDASLSGPLDAAPCALPPFAVKLLEGDERREAEVQALLAGHPVTPLATPVLGVDPAVPGDGPSDQATYLYLELIEPTHPWPWSEASASGRVLHHLAGLHAIELTPALARVLAAWSYEAELEVSAVTSLQALEQASRARHVARLPHLSLARTVPALKRLVDDLPRIRARLLAADPLGAVLLHGDVHPGNVRICDRHGSSRAVLLDWGRARQGSPLEDVSSWLQSLGCWEPQARRRHDTLLRGYLVARGLGDGLSLDLRDSYWLAGACNALAGALRFHLGVLTGAVQGGPVSLDDAATATRSWLRVIRRADVGWQRQGRGGDRREGSHRQEDRRADPRRDGRDRRAEPPPGPRRDGRDRRA